MRYNIPMPSSTNTNRFTDTDDVVLTGLSNIADLAENALNTLMADWLWPERYASIQRDLALIEKQVSNTTKALVIR